MRIASAQFHVTESIGDNLARMRGLLTRARQHNAHVIHFPEMALDGYHPRFDAPFIEHRWEEHDAALLELAASAVEFNLWIVVGAAHRRPGGLPHNATFVLSPLGDSPRVYAKRDLYAHETDFYEPGEGPLLVEIEGISCGFLICYENCFPQRYEAYRRAGAQVIFHSFFNAGGREREGLGALMHALLLARASDHGVYLSASNSSAPYSPLPATLVRPDGVTRQAPRHEDAFIVDDFPADALGWTFHDL